MLKRTLTHSNLMDFNTNMVLETNKKNLIKIQNINRQINHYQEEIDYIIKELDDEEEYDEVDIKRIHLISSLEKFTIIIDELKNIKFNLKYNL